MSTCFTFSKMNKPYRDGGKALAEFRGCWDVSAHRRAHYIRSIGGLGGATVPEGRVSAMGELRRVVHWVNIQFYSSQARPSLGKRVCDGGRSEDGVDPVRGDGCRQGLDHLLHPRKNVLGVKLIERQWGTDENRIWALRTRGDGEDEIQGGICGGVVGGRAGQPEGIGGDVSFGLAIEEVLCYRIHDVRVPLVL
jgi:hypothetical protein